MNYTEIKTEEEKRKERKAFEEAQRFEIVKKNQRRMHRNKNNKFKWS